jgi:hypothetical protein
MYLSVTLPRRSVNAPQVKTTGPIENLSPENLALFIVTRQFLGRGDTETALILLKSRLQVDPSNLWVQAEIQRFEPCFKQIVG